MSEILISSNTIRLKASFIKKKKKTLQMYIVCTYVCLFLNVCLFVSISGDAQDLKTISLSCRDFGGEHPTPSKTCRFQG